MMNRRPWVLFLFFLATFAFYTRNAAPSVTAGDSGEFITAAATLSLPHAPSFPFYTLTARAFVTAVPWGSVGYRCNLFSALTAAMTLTLLLLIAWGAGLSTLVALLLASMVGVTLSFWENSLVTEVFSLNTCLVAVLLWSLLRVNERRMSYWWLACYALGLGSGNHQIIVFAAPLFLVVAYRERMWLFRPRVLCAGALVFFLGFSIYLVLPIRAQANPPLNWGNPTNVERLTRTILRKDYGTLTLALGEKPVRSMKSTAQSLRFFGERIAHEMTWPLLLMSLMGLAWGLLRREFISVLAGVGFFVSGPFFIWLGNLPPTAQSEGIVGRFLIMPVLFLVVGCIPLMRRFPKGSAIVLSMLVVMVAENGWALASHHRQGTLVLDYGRALFRSLPPGSVLFMDGGDDTFYSSAMLQNTMEKRSDVVLHDRGGLIFPNPYGPDFRSLTKDQKKERRRGVELLVMTERPLFYVTMDPAVLPGVKTSLHGVVVKTEALSATMVDPWPFYVLRSLYPPAPLTFRTRALAGFFPFAYGQQRQNAGDWRGALHAYNRAWSIAKDVDWLSTNLPHQLAQWGYEQLISGRFDVAEAVYREWIRLDPLNMQAQSNLGVVLEKQGRLDEARAQYERAALMFPAAADPVFNLSVLAWKRGDWADVVQKLEEVLRRNPQHTQAAAYLMNAREKIREKKP